VRTNLKERDGNKVTVEVEVSPEELKEAFDVKLRELVREVRIPGFRPGKAPVTMVRQKLGDESILADAVESGVSLWFVQAMFDLGLEAVERPDVDMGEQIPDIDKPLPFTATVMVMPEVKLGEYKGLKVPKDSTEVTEAEIDTRVERLQNDFSELTPVEGRAAQKGDFVLADFQATLDGAPVNELEATDYLFEVGGNMIFDEVEEQVTGMNPGDQRSFPVSISEDIPAEELRGKTVEFSLTLKEVKEKVLPEVNDQWVTEVCEFKTVDEFRADIRSRLESAKAYALGQRFRAAAVAKAVENVTVELPEVVVRREGAELLSEFKNSIEARGGTVEDYLAATGTPFEKLFEDLIPQATNNVKTRLVLDAVAKAEALEVSDEELDAAIGQMALANRIDIKELQKRLRKNDRMSDFKEQLLRDKAAEIIVESSVAGPPEGDAGAGKKPAAKKASGATAKSAAKSVAKAVEAEAPVEPAAETPVADATDEAAGEGA
jgi:trigger factor